MLLRLAVALLILGSYAAMAAVSPRMAIAEVGPANSNGNWDPAVITSGLRVGTPALATRGFGDAEFSEVADIIASALAAGTAASEGTVTSLRDRVTRLAREFPLYDGLEDWSLI